MNEIVPVILAGGSGTRLWPISRKSFPKQFLKITENKSLFQLSAIRLITSKLIKFKPHITITNSEYRFFVTQQLLEAGINPGPIIIEPEKKNTAPAILSATLFAFKQNKDSILLVAPSDHLISDINEFHKAVKLGQKEIQNNKIITFGLKPTRPETGYGYLELEKLAFSKVCNIIKFIEKPDKKSAEKMIADGNYLWNSGIFMFKAKDMIIAFEKYAKELLLLVKDALKKSEKDLGFIKLNQKAWAKCQDISIDYAIMEKTQNLSVVPFSSAWSDLGDWNTIWKEMKPDENGVSKSSNAYFLDCQNTLLRTENKDQILVGLGLEDIVAVAMHDAVLVANKKKIQDIKKIVGNLKTKKILQSEISRKDYRPWGWFESLAISDYYQVKLIHINSGAALSMQSHNHRSEHWVVVKGQAKVTIDKEIKIIEENQSVFVPRGCIHRLENSTKFPIILIEVQMGSYLGEDDIVRYEDLYSRS